MLAVLLQYGRAETSAVLTVLLQCVRGDKCCAHCAVAVWSRGAQPGSREAAAPGAATLDAGRAGRGERRQAGRGQGLRGLPGAARPRHRQRAR